MIELSNYSYEIVKELSQSEIAATSLYIGGIATSGVKKWTKPLEKATGVTLARIKEICNQYYKDLPKKVKEEWRGRNIFRKY